MIALHPRCQTCKYWSETHAGGTTLMGEPLGKCRSEHVAINTAMKGATLMYANQRCSEWTPNRITAQSRSEAK